MADSIPDAKTEPGTESQFSRYKTVLAGLFLLLIFHLLLGSYAGDRHRHTCVVCRLERTDNNWKFFSSTSTFQHSSCSKWYSENVEPSHDHAWVPSPAFTLVNYYHQSTGAGDNDDQPGRAIWKLTPDEQLLVYQNSDVPREVKDTFLNLMEPSALLNRDDLEIVNSMRDWIDGGFSRPWHVPVQPAAE